MNVLPNSMNAPHVSAPHLSVPHPDLHLRRKRSRGMRITPLAAGIAGGSAVALIAYRKRHTVVQTVTDEADTTSATGESHELRRHVADMVALEREMVSSFQRQLDGKVGEAMPEVRPILQRAHDTLEQNADQLDQELGGMGYSPSAVMKKLIAMTAGRVGPLLGGARSEPVSRMLRDDVVGLHMAAVSASMLTSAAKAEEQQVIASIAKDGSESFSMLADELQDALPDAVTMEVEQRQEAANSHAEHLNDEEDEGAEGRMPAYASNATSGPINGSVPPV